MLPNKKVTIVDTAVSHGTTSVALAFLSDSYKNKIEKINTAPISKEIRITVVLGICTMPNGTIIITIADIIAT
jgi:hypothetical protein